MSQLLTKSAEQIAAKAVAAALSGGHLDILNASGDVLVKFDVPASYTWDPATSIVHFNAPVESEVQKMGVPISFRLVSHDGKDILIEGSAGEAADLVIPAKKLFQGMKVTVGDIDYKLRFNKEQSKS